MTFLPFGEALRPAVFLERPNRFLCRVLLDGPPGSPMGDPVEAHLPDPGRLTELLVTGRRVMVAPAASPERRTRWTMALVRTPAGDGWVSVDTTLPNRLLARAFAEAGAEAGAGATAGRRDALSELPGWRLDRAEAVFGASRFDFLLRGPGPERHGRGMILEAKSVTLVEDGRALFPDAVTARGARHVREMAELARGGMPATVIFVVQREDADSIEAAWEIDPDFADALAEAREAGVRVIGRRCRVTPEGVTLLPDSVPVLEPSNPGGPGG
ncbi:MAG: DNA/RNA nuclease SfsA [Gemmatimonadales bacterium]|nr:MAG: DNA/RNA nuclease SfsA [Gemmatimonadales bacterium]